MLKIGIITDVHGNTKACRKLMKHYEKEKCNAIIVPGDIARTLNDKDNLSILSVLRKTKLPVYVMPGNYETKKGYFKAIKKYKKNIHDCLKKPTAIINNYHCLFIPGSNLLTHNASFFVVNNKKEAKKASKSFPWPLYPIILPEITKHLKKDSILISHTPCKLPGRHAIDLAQGGFPQKNFIYREKRGKKVIATIITKRNIFPMHEAKAMIKKGYPVKIKTVHSGLLELTKIIKKKKVTKFISGHIHEAGRRATTLSGKKVKQNSWSKQLFYNPGAACDGHGGIVEFKGGMARFKNIKV